MSKILEIKNLKAGIEDEEIIKDLSLDINSGETHIIMGPNGSGKSTLAQVLMGSPFYTVEEGTATFDGKDLFEFDVSERSGAGLFMTFQHPNEIPGVSVFGYLRMIYNKKLEGLGEKTLSPVKFKKILEEKLEQLDLPISFMDRYLNDGFSGGERKRMEILQMLLLDPKLAILDEVDSGLDVDALKTSLEAIKKYKEENIDLSILIITHYTKVLDYIEPDYVHIMKDGKITQSGGKDLAKKLEDQGFAPFGEWLN